VTATNLTSAPRLGALALIVCSSWAGLAAQRARRRPSRPLATLTSDPAWGFVDEDTDGPR
jgi:hypothetical protein